MVRTQIQLTEEQAKVLRKLAITSHLSVAELIRRAVDTMIKSRVTVDPDERLKRALEIVGKFSSGKRDISRKHDAYLADALNK
jgi:ABC-type uncharacterized transport system ATPase subunit